MLDHAYFLRLGLVDEELKERAVASEKQWQEFIDEGHKGNVYRLLSDLKQLKMDILEHQIHDVWVGFLSYSFVTHILEELEMFEALAIGQKVDPLDELEQGAEWMQDHMKSLQQMTDPSEQDFKRVANQLIHDVRPVIDDDLDLAIALTIKAVEDHDQLIEGLESRTVLNTIAPRMVKHWLKESAHLAQRIKQLNSL